MDKRPQTQSQNHAKIHQPWFTVSCKFLLIFLSITYDFISVSMQYMYVFHKINEWFNNVTSKDMT